MELKKVQSVGLRAFKNKLANEGHENYYALSGETEEKFGFHILLGARIGNKTYSELYIWYLPNIYTMCFKDTSEKLVKPFSVTTGFEINIEKNYNISTETNIKNRFGTTSVSVTNNHLEWITQIDEGKIRELFEHNLWSEHQMNHINSLGHNMKSQFIEHLHYVEFRKKI